jgi:hypothetical protein
MTARKKYMMKVFTGMSPLPAESEVVGHEQDHHDDQGSRESGTVGRVHDVILPE